MKHYLVTANINVADPRREIPMLYGYQPHHPVATVGYWDIEADSAVGAAEQLFAIGNRQLDGSLDGEPKSWPSDVRSLSVGDVLYLADGDQHTTYAVHILACAPRG